LLADAGPQAGGGSGEWYFFNPSVRAGGVAAFKKKWGDRVLEDHWRTKDKPLQGLGSIAQEVATVEEEDTLKIALPSDDNQVEYYLARTLQSEQDLKKSLAREAEAKSELGFIYKDGLKDLKGADLAWIDYLSAFEGYAQYTPKVLYGIYLLRGEELDTERQETTRQTLLKNYPNSPYAALLRGEFKGPAIPLEEQAAYDLAVDAYSMGQTKTAKKQLDTFLKSYPKSALLPKASLLDAFLTGASGSAELVIEKLQQVVKEYAGTEEATRATQILSLLQDDGQEDTAGTLGKGDQKVQRMEFTEQANAPHKIILAIPAENAKINELRNALADFNKEHFKFDNLRIQNIFYDEYTQLIIISGLRTKEKAVVYLNTINELGASLEQYYPAQSSELFYIDNANFGKVYRDKVLKEYLQYFKSK
jgi:hypothetical protein